SSLTARDLFPIASFLLLRGRCRHCAVPIPRWHLAVEISVPALFLLAVVLLPGSAVPDQVSRWVLLALLLALTVIDLQTFLLPDVLVLAMAGVGVVRSVTLHMPPLPSALLGGIVGLGVLGAFALIPWRRRSGDRTDALPATAMGLGDAKLAGAMGVVLGMQGLITALFVAFVAGGAVGSALLLTRRATFASRIPFGPFLAGATMLILLFPNLPHLFFGLLGF
ncbi:MAG: leader peptidase (prepilin peptidase) / N-methyltransferase, partial [Parcubacteria group bacterium Gr01-1014_106]